MKKHFLLWISIFISVNMAFTQSVPQGINYQAVARDGNGNELANTSLSVKMAVMSKSGSTYTTQWEETHSVSTNDYGLFTLLIGQGTSTGGGAQSSFSDVPWSSYDMYLNVSVDDGNGYVDLGKNQLVSVPYAFVSGSTVSGGATGPTGPTGANGSADAWSLTGNSGTSSSTNFIGTTSNADMVVKTNSSEIMRFQSDGNVSIGSTSSYAKLSVDADSAFDPFRVRVDGNTKFIIDEYGQMGVGVINPDAFAVIEAPEDSNAFRVRVGGNTEFLVNRNHGVTIGTDNDNSPENGLYVYGQTLIGLNNQSSYYGSTNKLQVLYENSTNGSFYGIRSRVVGSGSSNSANGNYGVYGRATDVGFNYGLYGEGTDGTYNYGVVGEADDVGVYAIGDMWYSGSLSKASDERFKKDVKSIDNALGKIQALNPKTYNYKLDEYNFMNFNDKTEFGFIAQEVEKVLPELVNEMKQPAKFDDNGKKIRDSFDFKGVDYVGLVPVLTKAIQEQQKIIEQQNALIAKLQKENNVTKANFENQHDVNVELDAKLTELYKKVSALEIENSGK
jgi:hypothetical protein